MKNWKMLLLALVPVLGCVALARMGANRPEHLILGKWRVAGSQSTIEFKPDGTFLALGNGSQAKSASDARTWGRYTLVDRKHLRFEPLGIQQGGKPPSLAALRSSERVQMPANAVEIEREQVRVFAGESSRTVAQVWNRVE